MKISEKNKERICFALLYIIGMMLIVYIASLSKLPSDTRVSVLGLPMELGSAKGVLQSIISFLCVVGACVNYKYARVMASVLSAFSLFGMVRIVIVAKDMTAVPGIANTLITLLSVLLICAQLQKAEKKRITDDITGLYNRNGFTKEVRNRLDKNNCGTIAYIQLRNFRSINDNLGREYGDMALKIVGERMTRIIGKNGIVSRLDGTEYAIELDTTTNVWTICEEIITEITQKIVLLKDDVPVNFYLNAYAGVATYPNDAQDVTSLMKYADIAMNSAVKSGKEKVKFFNNELAAEVIKNDELQHIIKDALDNDYFYLVYQPQFTIKDKKLRGFETLLRCKLPDGRIISPGEFIPIAEKTELITQIDNYVFRKAVTEFAPIIRSAKEGFTLSVNVSAKSMASSNFVDRIQRLLTQTAFPPEWFEIEITEYSFSESREQTVANVKALRKLGIKIALDDFGTGYTSLDQLLELPISLLKVDKSLIDNIDNNQVNRDFIDSVIYMGHLIGCEVVSEGVESEAQLELLKSRNCDFVQGFVWGKPLGYEAASSIVEKK